MNSYILIAILFIKHSTNVSAFASYFVEHSISCWTYLESGEVIMNADVLPPSSSRWPDIAVVAKSETNNEKTNTALFENDERFRISMNYPSSMPLMDLQFVVETTDGAEFESVIGQGGIGCDGRRAFGRKRKTEMILKMKNKDSDGDLFHEKVEVWAGWATEHEAVTLTPRITFKYKQKGDDEKINDFEKDFDRKKLMTREELQFLNEFDRDVELGSDPQMKELNEELEQLIEKRKSLALEKLHQMHNSVPFKHDHARIVNSQIGKKVKDTIDNTAHFHETKSKSNHFRDKYQRDDFGSRSFSSNHFYMACVFLIVSSIAIIKFAQGGKRNPKGRRDL